jgi:ABC-type dipeptide/oligopeptide/nickel transport system permease component
VNKNDFIKKSVMFLPSIIVMILIFSLIAVFSSGSSKISFSAFFEYLGNAKFIDFLVKSLPVLLISLVISLLLTIVFSLSIHGSVSDMWLSLLHGLFVCLPLFLLIYLLTYVFSNMLEFVPAKGIFNFKSMIIPVLTLAFVFAFYVSFKVRYFKKINNDIKSQNFKKTLILSMKTFASEIGIFLTMLFITEFFFYSGGIGYAIAQGFKNGNIVDVCVIFIYASLIFLVLRYLFYLAAFLSTSKNERTA